MDKGQGQGQNRTRQTDKHLSLAWIVPFIWCCCLFLPPLIPYLSISLPIETVSFLSVTPACLWDFANLYTSPARLALPCLCTVHAFCLLHWRAPARLILPSCLPYLGYLFFYAHHHMVLPPFQFICLLFMSVHVYMYMDFGHPTLPTLPSTYFPPLTHPAYRLTHWTPFSVLLPFPMPGHLLRLLCLPHPTLPSTMLCPTTPAPSTLHHLAMLPTTFAYTPVPFPSYLYFYLPAL